MYKLIEVNNSHIGRGMHNNKFCPVALALKENGFRDVRVNPEDMSFIWDNEKYTSLLPKRVKRFVSKFDKMGRYELKPFKFKVFFENE